MNRITMILYVHILCLLYINQTFAQVTIWNENFESEGNGTRYFPSSMFWTDKGTYFTRTDGTNISIPGDGNSVESQKFINVEGSYFWAASNSSIIDPQNPANNKDIQTIVFPDINIEGYSCLKFTGIFAAGDYRWLNGLSCSYDLFKYGSSKGLDFLKVTYTVDGGKETTGLQFSPAVNTVGPNSEEDGPLGWDSDFNGVAVSSNWGTWLSSCFKSYSIENIPCGKKLTLKVYVRMNDVGESVAFDNFKITGEHYSSYLQLNVPLTDRIIGVTNIPIRLKNLVFSTAIDASEFKLVDAPPFLTILSVEKKGNDYAIMRLAYKGKGIETDYNNFRVAIAASQIKERIALVTDPLTIYACVPPTFELNQPQIINGQVTLGGVVNPHFLSSAITLEYGETTSYGNEIAVTPSNVDGTAVAVTTQPVDLKAGIVYHYRFKGINLKGTGYSGDATFSFTPVPELIISEICDPLNDFLSNRFIEIYNAGDVAIDLSSYKVKAVANNGSSENIWNLSGVIMPRQAKVCGKSGATKITPDFASEWSSIADWDGESVDGAQLYCGSFLLDDISGINFSDKHAVRNTTVRTPETSCIPEQWRVSDVVDANKQGTPGVQGEEIVWTGKSNSDWNEIGNWQPQQVPAELDLVRIPGDVTNIPEVNSSVQADCLVLESDACINKPENIKTNQSVVIKRTLLAKEWQYFTPPFPGITAGDLVPKSGDLYLIQYNNNKSTDVNKGWDYITDVKTPLIPGTGYGIWVTEPCELSLSGVPVAADAATAVSIGNNSWCMVGNPYTAPIDWTQVDYGQSNGSAYVFDPRLNQGKGNYCTIDRSGIANNGADKYIPPMQGFFVNVASSGLFRVPLTSRVSYPKVFFKNAAITKELISLKAQHGCYSDETLILCDSNAENGFNIQHDSPKLVYNNDSIPQIYTMADGVKLSINHILNPPINIPIEIAVLKDLPVSLSFKGIENLNKDWLIELEDRAQQLFYDLRQTDSLSFVIRKDCISNRFILHIKAFNSSMTDKSILFMTDVRNKELIVYNPRLKTGRIELYNMLGQQIIGQKLVNSAQQVLELKGKSGPFILRIITPQELYTEKIKVN